MPLTQTLVKAVWGSVSVNCPTMSTAVSSPINGHLKATVWPCCRRPVVQRCWSLLFLSSADSSTLPENLQEAVMDVLTTAECHTYWSSTQVNDNQVCVFDKQLEARATCNVSRLTRVTVFRRANSMEISFYLRACLQFSRAILMI